MSRDIKTVRPTATAAEARNAMRTAGVRHLLVLDGREVVEIVSDRDLAGRGAAAGTRREALPVADLMTSTLVSAPPDTTIRQAANLMRGESIGCLVVVDRAKPVGIVTTTDLLELIGRGTERPMERTTRWTLRSRGQRGARPAARHARRT